MGNQTLENVTVEYIAENIFDLVFEDFSQIGIDGFLTFHSLRYGLVKYNKFVDTCIIN